MHDDIGRVRIYSNDLLVAKLSGGKFHWNYSCYLNKIDTVKCIPNDHQFFDHQFQHLEFLKSTTCNASEWQDVECCVSQSKRNTHCIAISSRDKLFNHAIVTVVKNVKYARVYFVDYDQSELADSQSLFEILTNFVATNVFSYRITLKEATSLITFNNVSETFKRLVLNPTFKC